MIYSPPQPKHIKSKNCKAGVLRQYSRIIEQYQASYIYLYSVPSPFLKEHKRVTEWCHWNRPGFNLEEASVVDYSLCVQDITRMYAYARSLYKKCPTYGGVKAGKLGSRFTMTEHRPNIYSIDASKIASFTPGTHHTISWKFEYTDKELESIICGSDLDRGIASLFRQLSKVMYRPLSQKYATIHNILKLFPSAYVITLDPTCAKTLKQCKDLEASFLRKEDAYRCALRSKSYADAPCRKLYGRDKYTFLEENGCLMTCTVYRDRQKCIQSKVFITRPYTFLSTCIFENMSIYTPRTLMIVEDADIFFNALKKYFSFKIPQKYVKISERGSLLEGLHTYYQYLLYRAQTLEKEGWLTLIQGLKNTPPSDGRFTTPRYYYESFTSLYRHLRIQGSTCLSGLNYDDFSRLCKIKADLFKINLAILNFEVYNLEEGYTITPANYNHILNLCDFVKYWLILINS